MSGLAAKPQADAKVVILPYATQLADWMFQKALPFWASQTGICGMPIVEATQLDGSPYDSGHLRLRVMARQVAVFSSAADLGIEGTRSVAERAWEELLKRFYSPVSGWASRIGRYGQVIDTSFDLYDQAFAIYACACRARLTGQQQPIALAHRTARHIDELLRSGCNRTGWRSSKGGSDRDQNSHMHFLEALLALDRVQVSARTTSRIHEILKILDAYLIDNSSGAIREDFDINWNAKEPIRIEPGHQFEWYWLLTKASSAGFAADVNTDRLFAFAHQHGTVPGTGLIVNACASDGSVIDPDYRLWPHCEAIRAGAVHPDKELGHRLVEQSAEHLLKYFLAPAHQGTWHDRLDQNRMLTSNHVPASSLYHLWEAVAALLEENLISIPEGAQCS